ncbi:MAG: bifunctional (p)ppGpp synthetase/guanosine-3',5'-bis(diphosphate) 3'-pyrophosphohydrolase, partial [Candidatus Poribacteria bacterium]|nr:bifunctional (p)ppGpp synthetase/guanosine-3',5'-bis(diphosphate) 3'-pyrophosphohydrolase [Candidatus Poribacteria bacterium]
GQWRQSGEPYFTHCVATAHVLTELKLDVRTVCAGLLHDVIEDTSVTSDELESLFGETIAQLVQGVSKIGRYKFRGGAQQRQAENYLKLLLATAEDIRVILIKLADRLHNMETLSFLSIHRQQAISKETLEVYAPIAHRLGIWRIMSRLEDLAFKHLYPAEYRDIADLLAEKLTEREAYVDEMVATIERELKRFGIEASVHGRTKHIYSIYQKIHQKGTPFEEIRDLIGLRLLVHTVPECYAALGILHTKWHHLPQRLRDWIGPTAKINGYRSLHTTILDGGRSVEMQIRTHEMHKVAEDGIAAHWSYKEGLPLTEEGQSIFAGYKQMLEDIQESKDLPHQFIQSMKRELFPDEVYVFSPKGDLYALPAGATPIDFAYKIHTDIGHKCSSAEVNGALLSLRYRLQNGDRVKIFTNPNGHPNRNWLQWAKTARARSKIRQWFNEEDRKHALEVGQRLLENEIYRHGLNPRVYIQSSNLLEVATKLGAGTTDNLLMQIGNGKQFATKVASLLKPDGDKLADGGYKTSTEPMPAVQLEDGIDAAMVRIMKCCTPIPGDTIIGYITRGRGISIHKEDCLRLANEPERIVHVEWKSADQVTYMARISVECEDAPGMIGEIGIAVARCGVNIQAGSFGAGSGRRGIDGRVSNLLTLEVTGVEQLEEVMGKILLLDGVRRVRREA